MKKINLTITGCLGRMGQQLVKSSKKAKNFNSLNEALSKFNLVIATTNRKRFSTKKTYNNFSDLKKKIINFKNTAILFGPENSGLSNHDLRLTNYIFNLIYHFFIFLFIKFFYLGFFF